MLHPKQISLPENVGVSLSRRVFVALLTQSQNPNHIHLSIALLLFVVDGEQLKFLVELSHPDIFPKHSSSHPPEQVLETQVTTFSYSINQL
ncbi:Pentatricopeptide repeat-containing protein [Actinidia chinensis var. chinensis]|uniref:Pentatricopeptide repeat-containing protein n=1 Tax=Actinidia chinensis var. chinensis TaxID=1590841 RepID=A0A2R6RYK6_ACTCC|nr:Pentatricopeptide repeat-containing protein [Actinidia chinensis var. chinensis]